MDHHKVLYKDHHLHTPRHYNRINRELQEENRNKHRRNRFQDSRNISPSPIRTQKEIIIPLPTEKNDNLQENSSRLAKIVCNTNDPQKITKQEAFIKRFVEWMDNKKNMKQQEATNRKKPFVSAVNSNRQTTSCSLVPKGHHEGFVPPDGLKNPAENKKVLEDKNTAKKKRVSIYTVVPTPPRKKFNSKTTNSTTTKENKKTLRKSPEKKSRAKETLVSFKRPLEIAKKNTTTAQAHLKRELKPRALSMLPPLPPSTDTNTAKKQTGALTKIKSLAQKRADIRKKSPLKSGGARLAQTLKAKKPLNTSKKVSVPGLQINSQKLLKNIKKKQPEEDMAIQTPKDFATSNIFDEFVTSTRIKNSSQIMENVKSISPIETYKKSHGNSSVKRNIMLEAINTTQIKESEENKENPTSKVKKFNFIRYSEVANLSINDHNKKQNEELREQEGNVCSNENNITLVDNSKVYEKTPTKSVADDRPANYLSPFVSVARGKVNLKKEREKRNSIYLQNTTAEPNNLPAESTSSDTPPPMYSVEVRRTLEAVRYFRKQLQDEINRLHKKCDIWEKYKAENLEKIQNANGEDMINVTIGQTRLLTSKKFMQFKGLIDRCEAGATDIGVVKYDGSENTKPVVSGDLEGFWSILGLQVDNLDQRFENLNRWKLNDWNDPDKVMPAIKKNLTKVKKQKTVPAAKAKPNSALQQMLRKMKAEMRKNKPEENSVDVALTISKQKTRRSVSSNNSTPRKSIDIVVKDRKYFSHAATVISISSPNRKVSTIPQKSYQESPKMLKHIQKFNEALDATQSSSGLRRSVLIKSNSRRMSLTTQSPLKDKRNYDPKMLLDSPKNKDNGSVNCMSATSHSTLSSELSPPRSPVRTARKSILKTPGTAKSRLHNVIFNEKLRVKKFNFLINDEDINAENGEDANNTHEEDLAKSYEEEPQSTDSPQRTLTLRNRKVRLRPSCEIVIPKSNSR